MVFASPIFLFLFFPIVGLGYFIINERLRNLWLCVASFVFYAWGGLSYAILVLISTITNYFLGLIIGEKDGNRRQFQRRLFIVFAVLFNIGALAFFKYFNFITDNIIAVVRLFSPAFELAPPLIPLPIGISFFTFQIMSYVIDIYWGNVKPQRNLINLALYIMLFPQLIAGPIVRYIDIEEQIGNRKINILKCRAGFERFIIGLGKKVIIANTMGSVADFAFNNPAQLSTPVAWLGIICYSLQIYYDFSAYSDMAIGLGKIFGFDFLENFNYPYVSKSIQEFWRRWHISLSTWFRDYLYIPLGGNRNGKFITYRNLITVFFLTGLWHGASWNFVVWGLFHGAFLILERQEFGKKLKKLPHLIQHIYALFVVTIGWVFFRAEGLKSALYYLGKMFSFSFSEGVRIFLVMNLEIVVLLVLAIVFSAPVFLTIREGLARIGKEQEKAYIPLRFFADACLVILLFVSVAFLSGSGFNPFIYFRF